MSRAKGFRLKGFRINEGDGLLTEIATDHLLDIEPIESVLPGEMLVIDPDKGFKIVIYAAAVIRRLRISGTINGSRSGYDFSPLRKSDRHNGT